MDIMNIEAVIEGVLFAIGDAVELDKISYAINHDKHTTKKIIQNMMDKYEELDRGINIIEIDGAYQLSTKAELHTYISKVVNIPKKHNLTDVLLETLAIIAFKQPVTKLDIENVRGVKCDHAINKLLEYDLILEKGRLDAPGRPILFATSKEFLRCFALKDLNDLKKINNETIDNYKVNTNNVLDNEVQLKLNL